MKQTNIRNIINVIICYGKDIFIYRSTPKKYGVLQTEKNIKKKAVVEEVDKVMKNDELTDKQRLFCIYYVRCFNATKAYQKAYECSYETAMANGYKTLRNAQIKNEIYIQRNLL